MRKEDKLKSFWNGDSDLQDVAFKLQGLVPMQGPVEDAKKNKALERFRVASNCYYDLYNNGLDNRARQFSALFKVRVGDYRDRRGEMDFAGIEPVVEPIMRRFVLAAAKEQGIEVPA